MSVLAYSNKMKFNSIYTLSSLLLALLVCDCSAQTKKSTSGVYGEILRWGLPPVAEGPAFEEISGCDVVVKRMDSSREFKRVKTDAHGKYTIMLPPGKYVVFAFDKRLGKTQAETLPKKGDRKRAITVWQGFYTRTQGLYDAGW